MIGDMTYYLQLSYEHERLARRFDNQQPLCLRTYSVSEEIARYYYFRNEPIPRDN